MTVLLVMDSKRTQIIGVCEAAQLPALTLERGGAYHLMAPLSERAEENPIGVYCLDAQGWPGEVRVVCVNGDDRARWLPGFRAIHRPEDYRPSPLDRPGGPTPSFISAILWHGNECEIACDGKCNKAWGVTQRPRVALSEDPDDYAFLADHEVGEAPADPGTTEGGHAKPLKPRWGHNKWCARECERSSITRRGAPVVVKDFSRRRFNKRHRDADAP